MLLQSEKFAVTCGFSENPDGTITFTEPDKGESSISIVFRYPSFKDAQMILAASKDKANNVDDYRLIMSMLFVLADSWNTLDAEGKPIKFDRSTAFTDMRPELIAFFSKMVHDEIGGIDGLIGGI